MPKVTRWDDEDDAINYEALRMHMRSVTLSEFNKTYQRYVP
jgi:hypothetical protein